MYALKHKKSPLITNAIKELLIQSYTISNLFYPKIPLNTSGEYFIKLHL